MIGHQVISMNNFHELGPRFYSVMWACGLSMAVNIFSPGL